MTFPEDFVFGGATAAYQIEGAAAADGRGLSIWDVFSHTPGRTVNGDSGDVAIDHYHRYKDDVAIMASLGLEAYRFSVSWPRIQPDGRGRGLEAGLDFYSRLTDELLNADIDPWITLYHWDLPQALQEAGGWPNRDTAYRFADYSAIVHEHLGDRVKHWITLNEPFCSSLIGHASGRHAPGLEDPSAALASVHHLLLGHGLAVDALRAQKVENVGITLNLYAVEPASDDPVDTDAARRVDGFHNRLFLDPVLKGRYPQDILHDVAEFGGLGDVQDGDLEIISRPLDLLGVNYYTRYVITGREDHPDLVGERTGQLHSPYPGAAGAREVRHGMPLTDLGWEIDPDGLVDVLARLKREYPAVPIVITENGAAFADPISEDGVVHDADRIDFVWGHLAACERAIAAGVPLTGYFLWSIFDNYEWAEGYAKRFGAVHVDYETQVRTPKDSAHWYSSVIRTRSLEQQ
ncbi:GH1 family beta-glucosidase [Kineosporia mesophila]|uniref:Beta-glucosidase n=1 Tax=Kineosporia mesophila TaxID=566012 RepID=A0ABP6ZXI3_9ACTN|nr:GH1 family beta-glucosidase [Kineosporia mesophila]MCD5348702.1 beta-glucosidase [Kineosporia mesophila]